MTGAQNLTQKPEFDGEISGGVEGETTDDLSRVVYRTFDNHVSHGQKIDRSAVASLAFAM